MPVKVDLTGNIYGELTVISVTPGSRTQKRKWACICSCGTTTSVATNDLLSGHTKSCGCKKLDGIAATRTKHGYANRGVVVTEYSIWCGIKYRCFNPSSKRYNLYGGRGITMCKQWQDSFEQFLNDMGPRPSNKHSVDRYPNPNGNYEPGNCRWATVDEQMNNKINNIWISWNGEKKTLGQWAKFWNIDYNKLYQKYKRNKLFIVK